MKLDRNRGNQPAPLRSIPQSKGFRLAMLWPRVEIHWSIASSDGLEEQDGTVIDCNSGRAAEESETTTSSPVTTLPPRWSHSAGGFPSPFFPSNHSSAYPAIVGLLKMNRLTFAP